MGLNRKEEIAKMVRDNIRIILAEHNILTSCFQENYGEIEDATDKLVELALNTAHVVIEQSIGFLDD